MSAKMVKILFFGAAREAAAIHEVAIQEQLSTIEDLRKLLLQKYPRLTSLKSFAFAQNEEYVEDTENTLLLDYATIAILPPVSGG
ncbi:MAG TPA: MoaD/ThiS family protein [Saprospiraceae bacterium]|nr:MoaD/ThiS family protein [Saprospiraceae bacterium]HPN68686.1 MoaD/ThiS family protein [Saprospiraceae bacterium]